METQPDSMISNSTSRVELLVKDIYSLIQDVATNLGRVLRLPPSAPEELAELTQQLRQNLPHLQAVAETQRQT